MCWFSYFKATPPLSCTLNSRKGSWKLLFFSVGGNVRFNLIASLSDASSDVYPEVIATGDRFLWV